jgi:hypothetical protein
LKENITLEFVKDLLGSEDQERVFKMLEGTEGIGKFLAYQMFVDFTYIEEFPFSENEFVVSGPGCTNGLNLLFKERGGLSDEELLFWVRDNIEEEFRKRGLEYNPEELFYFLPEHDRRLNVMMVENSFCELGKLTKAKRGTGRPKNKYDPEKRSPKKGSGWL